MTDPSIHHTFLHRKKEGRWISKAMWWPSDRTKWGLLPGNSEASGGGKTFPLDRVKHVLKGHHDTLLRSGLTVSKLFLFSVCAVCF